MTETAELVLVPLSRDGAEVLHAAAHIGLEGADPEDIDVAAGEEAGRVLRRALDSEPEAEVAVVQRGISALKAIFSHEKDFVLIDPGDGVGFISGEDYAALYQLLTLLREGTVEDAMPSDDLLRVEFGGQATATARFRGATATVRIDPDPDPDFADTHLRVTLVCDPPPRGSDREVYSGPILIRDAGGER